MTSFYESSDGTTSEEEEFATLLEEDTPERGIYQATLKRN